MKRPLVSTMVALALSGCSSHKAKESGSSTSDWPPAPPAPEKERPAKQEPEVARWHWQNEARIVQITNVGWKQDERIFDFTMFETEGHTFFVYREFTKNQESRDAASGLVLQTESTDSADRWNQNTSDILTNPSNPIREWSNQTAMHDVSSALDRWLSHQFDRCLTADQRPREITTSFSTLGHVLVRSEDLFYADRALGAVETSLEVDWASLAPVGVSTLLLHKPMFSWGTHGPLPKYPELRLTAGSAVGPRLEGSNQRARIDEPINFRLACEDAYRDLDQSTAGPMNPEVDRQASIRMQRYLTRPREGHQQINVVGFVLKKGE